MTTTRPDRAASLALVLATALWGCSFTWAKSGGAGINEAAGLSPGAPLGPSLFLGLRFGLAALLWVVFRPSALRGWSRASLRRGALLGALLWVPMTFQMLGLDRTTEAVSAFLTSLTVIFVPLAMAFVLRRTPLPMLWVAVIMAASGTWLLTGASPSGFGRGELFGVLCAIFFSAHLIGLNMMMRRETVGRMTLAQFGFVGVGSLVVVALLPLGGEASAVGLRALLTFGTDTLEPGIRGVLASGAVWVNLLLTTVVSTIGAFALVFAFQPRVDPTRAAILYLAEPIFAALFAYLTVGRGLTGAALGGAGLILAANVVAEMAGRATRRRGSADSRTSGV